MIALDTNLLVYAHRQGAPEHQAAQRIIEEAANDPRGFGIALPTVAEFWMVVTHPSSANGPSSSEQAQAFIRALQETGGMQIFLPIEGMAQRLLGRARESGLRGARIFDLQIGIIAQDAGATELWTRDVHFAAPPGLRVLDPLS